MVCLGNRDHSVIFKIAFFKYCISDSLFECDGYSISSKGFLPIAATAKSLQSCPTLCDPIDGSPPGSPIPGILQPRMGPIISWQIEEKWK